MKLLVAAGASVLEKDNENTGVVHYSANKGNLECFKVRSVCVCVFVLMHSSMFLSMEQNLLISPMRATRLSPSRLSTHVLLSQV